MEAFDLFWKKNRVDVPVMRLVFLSFFVLVLLFESNAQQKNVKEFLPTEAVSTRSITSRKYAPKKEEYRFIIKNDGEGILYGNPCMQTETLKMGFMYIVQTPGIPGSYSKRALFWNNFKTRLNLTFTKSPFWRSTLKRRVKDCREKSGDFVG